MEMENENGLMIFMWFQFYEWWHNSFNIEIGSEWKENYFNVCSMKPEPICIATSQFNRIVTQTINNNFPTSKYMKANVNSKHTHLVAAHSIWLLILLLLIIIIIIIYKTKKLLHCQWILYSVINDSCLYICWFIISEKQTKKAIQIDFNAYASTFDVTK